MNEMRLQLGGAEQMSSQPDCKKEACLTVRQLPLQITEASLLGVMYFLTAGWLQ